MDALLGLVAQAPDFFLFLLLVAVGYVAGRAVEHAHYRSIRARERRYAAVLVFSSRFPPRLAAPHDALLVCGSVVVSEDYFKQAVAGLQTLFGGRLRSYESLLDRARREAVLRMKAQAGLQSGTMIVNVKFETYAVPGPVMGAVELLAYGTALVPRLPPGSPAAVL